jgi:hypothetical protein
VEDWENIFEIIEEELFDDYAWLEVNNYKKLDDKLIIPTDQEYEEALKWLYNAYANTWVNKSRLFMKEENNDKNISNKIKVKHDFFQFMGMIKDSMVSEYDRIHSRSSEDPGTAGNQAEENWAEFLRSWLPSNYPIVTKGRLIDTAGSTSPQVDILVLHPSYPHSLRNKKHYFTSGVIAAFECKLTLRKEHLRKFFKNSTLIKRMQECRKGTPYDELHQLPIYGLLTHSHNLTKSKDIRFVILELLDDIARHYCMHPRDLPDILCIADAGTFIMHKEVRIGPFADRDAKEMFCEIDKDGGVSTGYTSHDEDCSSPIDEKGMILGALIYRITEMMAYEDHNLRPFVDYLSKIGLWIGLGKSTCWDKTVLSREVGNALIQKGYDNNPWSKWAEMY